MNVPDGVRTVYIVRITDSDVEVFSSSTEAKHYARRKRGATVLERTVRDSSDEAQIVYDRRVHITDGSVRRDATTEEPFFTIGTESWIKPAEVESFEAQGNSWTIVGLGTERQALDSLVEQEIARLTSADPPRGDLAQGEMRRYPRAAIAAGD